MADKRMPADTAQQMIDDAKRKAQAFPSERTVTEFKNVPPALRGDPEERVDIEKEKSRAKFFESRDKQAKEAAEEPMEELAVRYGLNPEEPAELAIAQQFQMFNAATTPVEKANIAKSLVSMMRGTSFPQYTTREVTDKLDDPTGFRELTSRLQKGFGDDFAGEQKRSERVVNPYGKDELK